MIECSLKAIIWRNLSGANPYYGNVTQKFEITDTYQLEYDKRPDISPFGVIAKVTIDNERIFLDISRHYFNTDNEGWHYATFIKDEYAYRLDVRFKGDKLDAEASHLTKYCVESYLSGDETIKAKVNGVDFDTIDIVPF